MYPQKSLEELSLFIVLYMAFVDGVVHPTELEAIHSKAKELFPQVGSLDETMLAVSGSIRKMGKEAAEKYIEDNMGSLSHLLPAQRSALLQILLDVINADGRVDEQETRTFRKLRSVLTAF